ncbi:MAG: type toxin-antitoxin system RelE/ParE family toxin [Flavipsychrobacter sp.]|jgi:plasmid stabilization system protein ParE|nr:type toxin-antitoxin system RelE/ParE family toxin [Flavipsychrobacter sp.]
MAYEIIINKRFTNKLLSVLDYLEKEWSKKVALAFLSKVYTRIYILQSHPYIGSLTSITNVRSTLITKHNRMFYRIVGNKIVILNLYDTRKKEFRR